MLGVRPHTVTLWEGNQKPPGVRSLPKLSELIGLDFAGPAASIGRRLRECRRRLGLSQTALGQRLGISQRAMSSWELGKTQPRGRQRMLVVGFLGDCRPRGE